MRYSGFDSFNNDPIPAQPDTATMHTQNMDVLKIAEFLKTRGSSILPVTASSSNSALHKLFADASLAPQVSHVIALFPFPDFVRTRITFPMNVVNNALDEHGGLDDDKLNAALGVTDPSSMNAFQAMMKRSLPTIHGHMQELARDGYFIYTKGRYIKFAQDFVDSAAYYVDGALQSPHVPEMPMTVIRTAKDSPTAEKVLHSVLAWTSQMRENGFAVNDIVLDGREHALSDNILERLDTESRRIASLYPNPETALA